MKCEGPPGRDQEEEGEASGGSRRDATSRADVSPARFPLNHGFRLRGCRKRASTKEGEHGARCRGFTPSTKKAFPTPRTQEPATPAVLGRCILVDDPIIFGDFGRRGQRIIFRVLRSVGPGTTGIEPGRSSTDPVCTRQVCSHNLFVFCGLTALDSSSSYTTAHRLHTHIYICILLASRLHDSLTSDGPRRRYEYRTSSATDITFVINRLSEVGVNNNGLKTSTSPVPVHGCVPRATPAGALACIAWRRASDTAFNSLASSASLC